MALTDYLSTWKQEIPRQFFIPQTPFSVDRSAYSTSGAILQGKDTSLPIITTSSYGIVLDLQKKNATIPAALLGFEISDNVADCLQIQGGRGMYSALTPLRWDQALLHSLVLFSQELKLSAVRVIAASYVEGGTPSNLERLTKRYDINARAQGFRYSSEMGRYVKELRS